MLHVLHMMLCYADYESCRDCNAQHLLAELCGRLGRNGAMLLQRAASGSPAPNLAVSMSW